MAVNNPPAFLQNAGATHTAEMTRQAVTIDQSAAKAAAGMVPRGGVHPHLGGQLAVTQNGSPNMTVNVANGMVIIPGTEGQQSAYVATATSTTNLVVTAAHATLPRIDIVVAQVRDSAYSGANNDWQLAVVAGTAAGSPVAPTAPNNSITLASIAVAAATTQILTANITDTRIYSSYGIHLAASSAGYPSPAVEGMVCYDQALDGLAICIGSGTPGTWTNPRGVTFWQRIIYTSSSTFTKASFAGLKKVFVQCQGAGGGGGGAGAAGASQAAGGAGGGAGAYAEMWIDAASLAASTTVTVGTGGAGGVAAAVGTGGNVSSWGTAVVCPGGSGGGFRATSGVAFATQGGAGGVASAGDVKVDGGPGGSIWGDTSYAASGIGGQAKMGGGGLGRATGATATALAGTVGGNYGGGGSGALSTAGGASANGGAGAPGIVIVDLYI